MTGSVSTPELSAAIGELHQAFPGRVAVVAEEAAGSIVRITDIELSARWTHRRGELWFLVPYHYPDAAIYPYYVIGARRVGEMIGGLQPVEWREMTATQVSLRHNGWDPKLDTALGSVLQTQAWLREQ